MTAKWQRLFGKDRKPRVQVRLGDRVEKLTSTQAHRFEDLLKSNAPSRPTEPSNPFDQSKYSIEEAAFRLMVEDEAILQLAASGSVDLYTSVAGLSGHWQQQAADGSVIDSPDVTLRSGLLALTRDACRRLAAHGRTRAASFEFKRLADPSATELDDETLSALSMWKENRVRFLAHEPRPVEASQIVLLAPLAVPA